jgi:hypothetical protein
MDFSITPEELERGDGYIQYLNSMYSESLGVQLTKQIPFIKNEARSTHLENIYTCEFMAFPIDQWNEFLAKVLSFGDRRLSDAVRTTLDKPFDFMNNQQP